ncbi:DHH family phosphoesterase [Candidatus Woesearchaeota archaeon]|nr:DHH family phosphoesterase [Candidatus Woesearchaeota archaeon]
MGLEEFKQHVKVAAEAFKQLPNKHIKVVSHLDCDGLTAAAIITKALSREGLNFSLSIVKQVDQNVLEELSKEKYDCYIFTDLGSGYLSSVEKHLGGKNVFILDHHSPEDFNTGVSHVNPHMFGIDGSKEISGAGTAYIFAKSLNEENKDLAHLAIIGAIGDIQEKQGFTGMNMEILEDAVSSEKMTVRKGLSLFGSQTKPLYKVLEFSTDPYIPGVTGNEQEAVKFLNELGICAKDSNGRPKKLVNLSEKEMRTLVEGIIMRRIGIEENPEDVVGNNYLLVEEAEESPTRDAREFSTLLNSCGRLKKPSLGIATCLGDEKAKREAIRMMDDYRHALIRSLNWFYSNRNTEHVTEKDGYVMIKAGDNVKDTMIGTIASIISRSNVYSEGTIILSMANMADGHIKASLRRVGTNKAMDLRNIVKEIADRVGVKEAGGHRDACGCLLPSEKGQEFLSVAEEVMKKVTKLDY